MLLDQSDLVLDLRTANNDRNSILIQTYLSSLRNPLPEVFIETLSLVDSGSTAPAFADEDSLIKKHNVTTKRLLVPKPLRLADGLPSSFITHYFTAKMTIGHHTESMLFYVTKLSPSTPVILGMPWLKKHNPRIDFPVLELKFDSNYCAYNCLPWHIPDCNRVAPCGRIAQPTLRYRQPTVEEIPDTGEPIHAANKAEILEHWTTAPPLRNTAPPPRNTALPPRIQTPPELQVPRTHPLNPGQPIRHPTLSHLPYAHATARITAKGITSKTETRAIETSPSQRPTSHPSPARTVQGRRLVSAPPGRPSRASPAVAPENQTRPNLDDIRCTRAVNFTQFCKQKDVKVMRIHMAELVELVK